MWEGVRQKVSLLVGNGYPYDEVMDWSLGRVSDEAELVAQRTNQLIGTLGLVVQAAGGSMFSEEGGKAFGALIERLSGE